VVKYIFIEKRASPGIVEGGPRRGAPAVVVAIIARVGGAVVLTFAHTLTFATVVGVECRRGRGRLRIWWFLLRWHVPGPSSGMSLAFATTEGTLLLRARSRTRRHVPGPSSGPARSPRVRGRCGWCGRRGTAMTS
jgi:hypothetical protein